ncbi:MAG TPA: hypothetical protein VIZ17_11700 [Acetobacteraceae bacterium]
MIRKAAILLIAVMTCGTIGCAWADQPNDPAVRAVALFMQSCVGASGDLPALRSWVEHAGLPEVPSDRADEFLNGLPGAAYDASAGQLALVLVAQDDGSCSVVMDNANGSDLVRDLEQMMRAQNIAFTPTDDPSDPQTKDLNNREYAATKGNRSWHMLVSTVKNPAGGPAMLTTNP